MYPPSTLPLYQKPSEIIIGRPHEKNPFESMIYALVKRVSGLVASSNFEKMKSTVCPPFLNPNEIEPTLTVYFGIDCTAIKIV